MPPQQTPMRAYKVGDRDSRPWGEYEVTAFGSNDNAEFCEKYVMVQPGHILSLQSHDERSELWEVLQGELTVILNERVLTLHQGEELYIPQKSLHSMANLGSNPCRIWERQEGVCREDDIHRYMDAYGREIKRTNDPSIERSIEAYCKVLSRLQEKFGTQ